ncbi:hypothetical protein DPMN_067669 [Dreissena polymorpha]|uniref:Uncharacterized protein n=1 Tax=Dreissena polymorpha TaxID=45954 RepID=A0A9D3YVP2_DREPO|nr:hypothetical protein DPMN_067669 [Dreissena polymorpha]
MSCGFEFGSQGFLHRQILRCSLPVPISSTGSQHLHPPELRIVSQTDGELLLVLRCLQFGDIEAWTLCVPLLSDPCNSDLKLCYEEFMV